MRKFLFALAIVLAIPAVAISATPQGTPISIAALTQQVATLLGLKPYASDQTAFNAAAAAASPVQSVAGRVGAITLSHSDVTDWTAQTAVASAATVGTSTYTPSEVAISGSIGSGVFNLNATNLRRFRAAIARVRAGTGRGTLLTIGDSTTSGAGGGTGGTTNYTAAFSRAYTRTLASVLGGSFATSDNSFIHDQNVGNASPPVAYGTYDTRVTLGAGWSATPAGFAGSPFKYTLSGGAGTLSFTPAATFDTIIIRYLQQTGNGSFNTNIDGGASLGTTAAGGTSLLKTVTFTVARGTHTVNIIPVDNANFWIQGITVYDSTVPAIDVIQAGHHGATASMWVVSGAIYTALPTLAALAPDLTVICLTINDSNGGTSLATYQANIQTLITAAAASGDVVLMVGAPSSSTAATNGTLDTYIAVLRTLATANNIGLIDLKYIWGSYAISHPLMPYFDTLHPGSAGYKDIGAVVAGAILRVAR